MANDTHTKKISLDLTRLKTNDEITSITRHIKDNSKVSVLLDHYQAGNLDITGHNAYNLYGYINRIIDNSNTESKVNYSGDICRTIGLKNNPKNRYSNYKYAYHYYLLNSNYTKFSRYNDKATYRSYFNLVDFYSLLSFFDKTIHPYYNIFLDLVNSEYYDFYSINTNTYKDIVDPISYHGRDVYMDANMLYLKIESKLEFDRHNYFSPYKYMIIELSGKTSNKIKIGNMFSLCKKHAYLLNDTDNRLIIDPIKLLSSCKATKFGDPDDNRTLLYLTDVYSILAFCSNSNIEDLSMHTIRMTENKNSRISLAYAFMNSKIRKLPKGLIESIGTGGYSSIDAEKMFYDAKNVEMDISTIEMPTKGDSPSEYNLRSMYENSNCRHINRSIISKNDKDRIEAVCMYKSCNLIEDRPLPDGMFKKYTQIYNIFDEVTFETADSFKYIYGEFTKSAYFANSNGPENTRFENIIIKNNINGNKVIIGSGSDYPKTKLSSFTDYGNSNTINSEPLRLSIMGKLYSDYNRRIVVVGASCKELSFGSRLSDLRKAADKGFDSSPQNYIFDKEFADLFKNNYNYSTRFFYTSIIPADHQVFRRLSMLMIGDDYYNRYDYLIKKALQFKFNEGGSYIPPTYNITSILHSVTGKNIDILSLDEIKDPNFINPIITKQFYSACAIINTNGKNLKWTIARTHRNGISKYHDLLSVFTNAVYLYRAIKAQMYFTDRFVDEKIEFVFKANDEISLFRFLAVMSLYMDPNDPQKAVGRYLLIYNGAVYDSKTDMARITALATTGKIQEYVREINENRDMYDDGFVDEV